MEHLAEARGISGQGSYELVSRLIEQRGIWGWVVFVFVKAPFPRPDKPTRTSHRERGIIGLTREGLAYLPKTDITLNFVPLSRRRIG